MDPLTQGAFGALCAQSTGKARNLSKALVIGGLAGMAPDLDIFIRSGEDPLLAVEYHRHFTHALLFIPLGALLCSLIFYPIIGRLFHVSYKQTYIWCLLGVASHGLVDSLTSYGTLLLWPFTNARIAWDLVSIIDPLITLPVIVLILLAAVKKQRLFTWMAFIWVAFYLSLAGFQKNRAIEEGLLLAQSRELDIVKIDAKPSFGNILIWKVITTTKDRFYVDAIKVFWGPPVLWEGGSIEKLSIERDLPWLDENSAQRKDIERFRWFSDGYIALDQSSPDRIVDIRYSLLPQDIKPLWGIELSQAVDKDSHVRFYMEEGDRKEALKNIWGMLLE